jgi:hypothetical protein
MCPERSNPEGGSAVFIFFGNAKDAVESVSGQKQNWGRRIDLVRESATQFGSDKEGCSQVDSVWVYPSEIVVRGLRFRRAIFHWSF